MNTLKQLFLVSAIILVTIVPVQAEGVSFLVGDDVAVPQAVSQAELETVRGEPAPGQDSSQDIDSNSAVMQSLRNSQQNPIINVPVKIK
jgi:hypothetical protein